MENDNVVYRNGNRVLVAQPLTVVRARTSIGGGARVLATPPNQNPNSDESDACKTSIIKVKDEPQEFEDEAKSVTVAFQSPAAVTAMVSDEPRSMLAFDDTKVASVDESLKSMEAESTIQTKVESSDGDVVFETQESVKSMEEVPNLNVVCDTQESVMAKPVKVEPVMAEPVKVGPVMAEPVKVEQVKQPTLAEPVCAEKKTVSDDEVEVLKAVKGKEAVSDEVRVLKVVKKEAVEEKKIHIPNLEDGEFPVEPGWSLLGRKIEIATSTAKGVRRLVDNEIIHFDFPNPHTSYKFQWIVRVSTKRSGVVLILSLKSYIFVIVRV